MNNCLPTKFNLSCKKIVKDYFCQICKMQKEIVSHALSSCGGAMDVWADNLSPVQKWASTEKDIQELWADRCNKLKREDLELMAVVLRRIWLRRNIFVFENKFEGPDVIFRQAIDFLLQFQEAQQKDPRSQIERSQRELCRWKVPIEDQVKVNWDAALKVNEGRMGIGVVMRDEHGDLLVSLCAQKRIVTSPLVAEFQALWRAMQLCADLNLLKVVFEGDALSVIKAVNDTEASWEWHGQLVEDIKGNSKNRSNWTVTHTYRECNSVAHFLAKSSLLVNEETICIEEGPLGIQYYVQKDKDVTVEEE
ncbi:hypothetical protein F2P56_032936 [Juglans regia]|uniref:RNase H type-1 domain-containing protein n=1 Tax=Juglans regia TaxID=51240 RepID=A0A833TGN3_JUGRE|nr:hypothetical protein F2P56_032936 [Juglans regia]